MSLKTLRHTSRLVLALAIVVISTGLFALWWRFLKPEGSQQASTTSTGASSVQGEAQLEEKKQAEQEEIKNRLGSLFLADGDLMEADTGTVLQKNWLGNARPLKIWFDEDTGKFIGQFQAGFIRYNLDGSKDQELGHRFGVLVSDDRSLAIYSENGNIWTAGIDWRAFELVEPKQITSIGGFQDAFVLQNVMMASKDAMIVQNLNQQVRVDLRSGTVTPTKIAMTQASQRRSPDSAQLVGEQTSMKGRTVFVYDVATDTVKTANIGTAKMAGSLWLGEKRCCLLIGGQVLLGYDREKGTFEELMKLPVAVNRITGASPTGRFVFCVGINSLGIADLEKKNFIPVKSPPQKLHWIGDDTLLMARDIQDSQFRGTWVQKLDGGEAERLHVEPYAFQTTGGLAVVLTAEEKEIVIFGVKNALLKMKKDGADVKVLAACGILPAHLLYVNRWKGDVLRQLK